MHHAEVTALRTGNSVSVFWLTIKLGIRFAISSYIPALYQRSGLFVFEAILLPIARLLNQMMVGQ